MNELDAYLAANRERYTSEALANELMKVGHDRAAIDEAWARVTAADAAAGAATATPIQHWDASPPVATPAPATRLGAGTVLLIVFVVVAYGLAIVAAGLYTFRGGAVSILMIAYVIAMLIGLRYSVRRLIAAPTLRSGGSAIAVAFAISVVIFIGLSGACFVGLGPALNASGGMFG